MARPVQKKIKEMLAEFAAEQKRLNNLSLKRDEAIRPLQEKHYAEVEKKDKKFAPKIESSRVRCNELQKQIELEMQKGFDLESNSYSLTKVETDDAFVEINTGERRNISPEEWLEKVPKPDQNGEFWETINVLIGKAEKFRSDIVEKIAEKKRTHSFTVRLK